MFKRYVWSLLPYAIGGLVMPFTAWWVLSGYWFWTGMALVTGVSFLGFLLSAPPKRAKK